MSEENLLEVRGLIKHFPVMSGIFRKVTGYVRALDGISFNLAPGSVLGIVGETGCGKSTLGRAILRLIEPTAGEVIFGGRNVLTLDHKGLKQFRQEAQIIFQDPLASLNPRKTILDCVGEALLYHGLVKDQKEQKERVAEVLAQVSLPTDVMFRYPHQFSGGQQQRICIARAIALNPRLIVCDEALSALDVSVQAQILDLLQDLKQRLSLSYVFISHDLSAVRYLCDRVMVLYLGQLMEAAQVKELFNHPRHPYTQALLAAIPKDHPLQNKDRRLLHGEIPSSLHPPSGCPFRTRCPFAEPICSEEPPYRIIKDHDTGKMDHEYRCIL
jgi:peptide/nickel transport system ATP-binding protein/oligopeptide transport system ATP-binding protein